MCVCGWGLSIDNIENVAVEKFLIFQKYNFDFLSFLGGRRVLSTSNFVTIANGHFDC